MSNRRSNKQHLEYIFVPSGDQALASGTLSTTGTSQNIADGQLGLKVATHNANLAGVNYGDFVAAAQTATDVDAVQLIMGTPYSADTTKVRGWDIKKAHQAGPILSKNKLRTVSARICKTPTYSATYFTGLNAPTDLDLYSMYVEFRSVRKDKTHGRAIETLPVTFVTPDYTDLGTTDPLDHLLKNMLHRVNLASSAINTSPSYISKGNKAVLAFGIKATGGAGTAVKNLACGDVVTVMTTTNNGTPLNSTIVVDETLIQTIADWILSGQMTGNETIQPINILTAGEAAATASIDGFVIMGTDHVIGEGHDDVYSTKVRVDVEIGEGFAIEPLYTKSIVSRAFDGYGSGRQWKIRYDERAHGLNYIPQLRGDSDDFFQVPSGIDESKSYNAFIIESFDSANMLTREQQVQSRTIILMECTSTCQTPLAGVDAITVANAQPATVTSLNLILSPWLASAQVGGDNLDVLAGAEEVTAGVTATNYFV